MTCLTSPWGKICRKKSLQQDLLSTEFKRCLNLFDLVFLGIGNMVGAGIFVVTGNTMKNVAGPGVILSFAFAGIASFLSALCYAEFGSRVPKAGSAYTYAYISVGELMAFVIGWNMLLECIIGASSVAKAWSGALDVTLGHAISNNTVKYVGEIHAPLLSDYPDFLAAACIIFWTVFVACGAKLSSSLITLFSAVNVLILIIIIGMAFYYADFSYWKGDGFLPYGFSGTLAGSASCFFAYAGFEAIATAGEETKHPSRDIPMALGIAVTVVTILYLATAASLSLLVSFKQIDIVAPFPAALAAHGLTWAPKLVAIGTVIGLSAGIVAALYGMSRLTYSMASDGLIFSWLGYVHPKTQTPIFSTLVFGLLTAAVAVIIDLELLVELLSIGVLCCFTIVSASVLLLRYQPAEMCQFELTNNSVISSNLACESFTEESEKPTTNYQNHENIGKLRKPFSRLTILRIFPPGQVGPLGVSAMVVFSTSLWSVILFAFDSILSKKWWALLLLILFSCGLLLSYCLLSVHEENRSFTSFQIPFVPLIPSASLIINIGLMLNLNKWTWVRLAGCLVIGLIVYFGYGIRHSKENKDNPSYELMVSSVESDEETTFSESKDPALNS